MSEGYVLDFSNRTIEEFFEDSLNIDFYNDRHQINGTSKAKILRTILDVSNPPLVGEILRQLWSYRDTLDPSYKESDPEQERKRRDMYFQVIRELEGETQAPDMSAFVAHTTDTNTLGILLEAIQRDTRDDNYIAAMDRLHTYCVNKFRHLLESRYAGVDSSIPLNGIVGKYCKELEREGSTDETAIAIIKMSISVFERFNTVRNNKSLAHDNPSLINANEARFVFDSVSTVLRFVKATDQFYET